MTIIAGCLLLGACAKKTEQAPSGLPADFNSRSDAKKMEYLMRTLPADSVARFVIDAALGNKPGVSIDTVSNAVLYVYSFSSSDDQLRFSEEYQKITDSMTPAQRVKLFEKGTAEDPLEFGFELGLNYLNRVRSNNLSAKQVEKEIAELRKACAGDTMTYRRFVTGFTTVLNYDKGKDVKKEIFNRFATMSAE